MEDILMWLIFLLSQGGENAPVAAPADPKTVTVASK
jgi:hypothetical protein